VKRLGVALDLTSPVLEQAIFQGVDCLVTHHPFLFKAPKKIDLDTPFGRLLSGLIRHDIALVSAHTNLDAAEGGVNDVLARGLGLKGLLSLCPPKDSPEGLGLGRVGDLPEVLSVEVLARRVGEVTGSQGVQVVGPWEKKVSRVALCAGAGGDLLSYVFSSGAEVYITGEIKYHQAREAEARELPVIVAGHFETEALIVPEIARFLREWFTGQGKDLEVYIFREETPFKLIKAF
jgi:dinuclear metal center YbgI/SA1388 family protein